MDQSLNLDAIPTGVDLLCRNPVAGWFECQRDPTAPRDAQMTMTRWGEASGVWWPFVTEWKLSGDAGIGMP